jgi:hypothetical protein
VIGDWKTGKKYYANEEQIEIGAISDFASTKFSQRNNRERHIPIHDLIEHEVDEIWVIQINSSTCARVPTETHEILDRRNEATVIYARASSRTRSATREACVSL